MVVHLVELIPTTEPHHSPTCCCCLRFEADHQLRHALLLFFALQLFCKIVNHLRVVCHVVSPLRIRFEFLNCCDPRTRPESCLRPFRTQKSQRLWVLKLCARRFSIWCFALQRYESGNQISNVYRKVNVFEIYQRESLLVEVQHHLSFTITLAMCSSERCLTLKRTDSHLVLA
jgi:hypothetical protein